MDLLRFRGGKGSTSWGAPAAGSGSDSAFGLLGAWQSAESAVQELLRNRPQKRFSVA
jgi:hypothetical protein